MALYVKVGALGSGSWRQITDGNVRVKSGSSWAYPSKVYAKIGALGAGYWRDTGYASYPTAPSAPWVEAWGEFNYTYVRWNPSPAGGAPVSFYRVYQLNSAGQPTGVNKDVYGVDGYGRWLAYFDNVGEDYHNQYYVEARSAAGLTARSPGYLNVRMGHSRLTAWRDVAKQESWNSALNSVNLYLSNYVHAIYVPGDVAVSSWYVNFRNEQAGWAKLSPDPAGAAPPGGRRLFHVFRNAPQWADWHNRLDVPNPWSGWQSMVHWGENTGWGFAIDGTGYSSGSTGSYRIYGEFQIWGTRHYTVQEEYETRAYAGNTSWMT